MDLLLKTLNITNPDADQRAEKVHLIIIKTSCYYYKNVMLLL